MDRIIKNVFEIPGEFLRVAKQQIIGPPPAVPEEKQQAIMAKKKLPGLTANDQKRAAQGIVQIRKQLVQAHEEKAVLQKQVEEKKKKDLWAQIRNQQYTQTGERKIGGFG